MISSPVRTIIRDAERKTIIYYRHRLHRAIEAGVFLKPHPPADTQGEFRIYASTGIWIFLSFPTKNVDRRTIHLETVNEYGSGCRKIHHLTRN